MIKLAPNNLEKIKYLYYEKEYSMREIAEHFNISLDAVTYFMRKHDLKRRNFKETNSIRFKNKKLSFKKKNKLTQSDKELQTIGVMLYWAEGYKTEKASGIDFANSDPLMIAAFIDFLRTLYQVDEARFRVLLYCHKNQDVEVLKRYWSRVTKVPLSQFTKPYVRNDFRKDGRKMEYGMIHLRYHDKKLLLDIKNLIECYTTRYK